jgi:hypothetical protein
MESTILLRSARCEQLSGSHRAREELNGKAERAARRLEAAMKVTTIALATAFALTSTLAFAQTTGTEGYGSVVRPSVGSCAWPPVGSALAVPTWRNTGPAVPLPSSPAFSPIPAPTPTVRALGARRWKSRYPKRRRRFIAFRQEHRGGPGEIGRRDR